MEIIYEDKDIIVVNKESGLPVQAGSSSQKDLISILKTYLSEKPEYQGKGEPYLGIIHRLDQPVEGLLVFAKNNKAAGILSKQVQAKADGRSDMRKVYQAMVILKDKTSYEKAKKAEHSVAVLQDYLRRNYQKNTTEIVPENTRDGKWAELTYRTLKIWTRDIAASQDSSSAGSAASQAGAGNSSAGSAASQAGAGNSCAGSAASQAGAGNSCAGSTGSAGIPDGCCGRALLEIHLHTGRHHQIRVQLAGAGLPLDGDRKYGPAGIRYDYNLRLCSCFLQFRHPATGKKMQFKAKPSFLPE